MIKRSLSIFVVFGCLSLFFSQGYAKKLSQDAEENQHLFIPLLWNTEPHDWIGPEGGVITAIAISPQNPTIVFAGSWGGGVYKSIDGGATWRRASQGLGNSMIASIAIDPATPAILYAGTYKGKVYKSTDGGATWRFTSDGIQNDAIVYSIVIDPHNTQRVYVATRGISNNGDRPWAGVVYRSEDAGTTWIPSLYDLGGADYQDWVYALEINPNAPHIIFAATHEHGPVRSNDYGNSWEVLNNGISNPSTRAIVVDPRPDNADLVYTGVWTRDGVFKSSDGGETWEMRSNGLSGANIYRMAINPFMPNTLYAGTYNMGVMKTTNGAKNWFGAGLEWVGIAALQVNPADGQIVFAGTDGDGLYKSWGGSQSWTHSQTGLTASSVTSLIVSPGDPSSYYASLNVGSVMRSQDRGLSWSMFNTNLSDRVIHALVKHPLNNTLFALTESAGLYRYNLDDENARWEKIGLNALVSGFPAPDHEEARFSESGETFLSSYNPTQATDHPLAHGGSAPLLTMAFAPSDANIVYIGTYAAGVYKSTDGGNSWAPTQWVNQKVWSIAIHPQDPKTIYTTTDQPETIGVSVDGGDSWQELILPGFNAYTLAIPPAKPKLLLAGSSDGIYQLLNGAWMQIGLAGETVTALSIHPNRPNLFVAGTTNGAWLSLDSGSTWLPGPVELQGITVNSISFSPHNPDVIFYNTTAHGTLRVGNVQ